MIGTQEIIDAYDRTLEEQDAAYERLGIDRSQLEQFTHEEVLETIEKLVDSPRLSMALFASLLSMEFHVGFVAGVEAGRKG